MKLSTKYTVRNVRVPDDGQSDAFSLAWLAAHSFLVECGEATPRDARVYKEVDGTFTVVFTKDS